MADASGGPKASYMNEVNALRQQMADIPQLTKKREVTSLALVPLSQGPGRSSKSLQNRTDLLFTARIARTLLRPSLSYL